VTVTKGSDDPSAPPTTALLLRHGQTELSVQKRFSGTGDQPLTEHGRLQAAAAAARLAGSGATAVVSSPVRRARETAELVFLVAGDDDVARVYERTGFARLATVGVADLSDGC